MKVYINRQDILRRARRGRNISLLSLLALFCGLLASFIPSWYLGLVEQDSELLENPLVNFLGAYWAFLSFGCLILGFIGANVGSYYVNRWGRRPRADELMARAMKGFDDRYELFSWVLPAGHVILSPAGVFALAPRVEGGKVYYRNGRWRQPFRITRIFTALSQEGLGNPSREVEQEVEKLTQFVEERDPNLDVTVEGAVIFLHPKVEVDAEGADVTVLLAKTLKNFLRNKAKEGRLPEQKRKALSSLFAEHAGVEPI